MKKSFTLIELIVVIAI
ncbi:MAG: prepilin-type N-terminal cleavage/methylation domain-containing protein, partial [Candidatus Omnitrophica bacterium]|nr:prepilin-type N-terminal cleavage/methylation domain-containing protein [Candidatus Omnitrophota bacterium]